ncbi:APC family permease [Bifidobacterium sp. 82T24]|uniref:APC family permease n=1 Tax=Bifidobacterium pluvialisilvae TaxID=2834436 RepID=UPI001C59F453|nr:APC family permease [Bifidobacterium pluvialisilvae]MBW3087443.1 APC family permease [Bifidobacterium pluvialisilvae]
MSANTPTTEHGQSTVSSAEQALESQGYKQELKRSLPTSALVVYGLVFIVPIAPMSIFGVVFNLSHGMVALTYIIGFIAMLFTAMSYRIMANTIPTAGSVYSYVGAGLGKQVGFLSGWLILLDYLLFPTLASVLGAVAMHSILPAVPQIIWVVLYIALSTTANCMGIKWADSLDKILLLCQIIVFVLFVWFATAAVMKGVNGAHFSARPFYDSSSFSVDFVFTAISVAALNFLGFDAISTLSEEAKGGGKAVGRAIIISLFIVIFCFVALTALATWLVPDVQSFADGNATNEAFFDVAYMVGGTPLKVACAAGVSVLSAVGNVLTSQAAVSRVLFSMGRDRMLPGFLGQVSPKHKVPRNATLLVGGITLVLGFIFVGDVSMISSLVNVGALSSFALLNLSVIALFLFRKHEKAYIAKGLFPLIGFVILVYVLIHANVSALAVGGIWFVIGVIVLVVQKAHGRSAELDLDA